MSISACITENGYKFTLNGYEVYFIKTENSNTRANLWNIMGIFKQGNTVCTRGTDIVGVLKEKGESDYMGGVHGDEECFYLNIVGDGSPITDNVMCSKVTINMNSHLTRVSSGENIINRYVTIELENSCITVTTEFKCLVNDFNLEIAFNGGMFAWRDKEAKRQRTNLGEITSDGGKKPYCIVADHDITYAECETENARVKVENIIGHEGERYVGKAFYYGNEENPRVKIYFSTDENSVWHSGHVCKGKARYTLL